MRQSQTKGRHMFDKTTQNTSSGNVKRPQSDIFNSVVKICPILSGFCLRVVEVLTKEGFNVMVYCNDDPLMAKRLENAGAAAIMPLAAPIGSGLGIQNKVNIKIIRDQTKLPLIIDAGIGQASDAAETMELGCDGVLINSAIAKAKRPVLMAKAFKDAVISGRKSFLAGRMEKNYIGIPSSPSKGII